MPEQSNQNQPVNGFEPPKVDLSRPAYEEVSPAPNSGAVNNMETVSHTNYFGETASDTSPDQHKQNEMLYSPDNTGGSNKKLFIIIAAVVAAVLLIGGATFAFLSLSSKDKVQEEAPSLTNEAPAVTEEKAPTDEKNTEVEKSAIPGTDSEEASDSDTEEDSGEATEASESSEASSSPAEEEIEVPAPTTPTPDTNGSVEANG